MKKAIVAVSFTALLLGTVSVDVGTEAQAKRVTCKDVNKEYSQGVSKKAGTKNQVGTGKKAKYKYSRAKVSKSAYNKYKRLDRDKDGITCEK